MFIQDSTLQHLSTAINVSPVPTTYFLKSLKTTR